MLASALAGAARAQDPRCKWCNLLVEKKVYWKKYVFCSDDCRYEWYTDQRHCKICNQIVGGSRGRLVRSDGYVIYIDPPESWDGFCDTCRAGVKKGKIDPVKDRYRPPVAKKGQRGAVNEPRPRPRPRPAPRPPQPPPKKPEPANRGGVSRTFLHWVGGAIGLIVIVLAKRLRSH